MNNEVGGMMPGKRQAKRKASMPRTVGMVIFRILAIGACMFALLIFVGGLSTDFLTCTIIALIISFIGWMLWVIGDMIHDPEKIRAEQRAARAAKDPSIVLDEDSERERKRAANGHWDGRANPGYAEPKPHASPEIPARQTKQGLLPDDYVVLDLETTGKRYADDEIIEIGVVKVVGRKPIAKYQKLINPKQHLDPFITSLIGITDDMLQKCANARRSTPGIPRMVRLVCGQ